MVHQETIGFRTKGHGLIHDLTGEVAEIVRASGMKDGIVNIFNVGSTGAVGTIEYEPGLVQDLPVCLNELFPPGRNYYHEQTWHDGNGHSHLQATLLGPSLTVPFGDSRLLLGTWQQVIHLECDVKPHDRKVVVTVYGE